MAIIMKKIIICGLGSIGRRHFRIIKGYLPKVKIGIIRSGKGEINKESLNSDEKFKNFEEAISWGAEAAIISSPATLHFEHSEELAKNNIPLLIEKPLDSDYADLNRWEELRTKHDFLNVLIGYVLRHDPALIQIKKYLKSNKIGDLINVQMINGSWLPSWRSNRNYKKTVSALKSLGGGILLEQSHDINLASDLFGELSIKNAICKNSKTLDLDVEDSANIGLLNSSGTPINIHMDFCSKPVIRELLIRGSNGSIKWDIKEGDLILSKDFDKPVIKTFSNNPDTRLLIQFKHFLDVCAGKSKPLVTVDNALKTLKLIKKIRNYKNGI